ncbi:MAG: group III truncated hemoglobin [Pseudomonadota bacterium]
MNALRPDKRSIDRTDIERLVAEFYRRVRLDQRLGPIFHAHIGETDAEWAPHLKKIEDFWANVMLKERAYSGNPMQIHMGVGELRPDDFPIWLAIFDDAAAQVLPTHKAQAFSTLAHRIGRSLSMGLAQARAGEVPRLAG